MQKHTAERQHRKVVTHPGTTGSELNRV